MNARNQHRWPIKSISNRGWVAQLAEQWTENLVFVPRDRFPPSHGCEHERTVMTRLWYGQHAVNSARAGVKRYPESQTDYLAVTVIVVVVQEPIYPAGRLCDVIPCPPGPTVVTLVVNPALLQIDWARFNRTPIKLGTVH